MRSSEPPEERTTTRSCRLLGCRRRSHPATTGTETGEIPDEENKPGETEEVPLERHRRECTQEPEQAEDARPAVPHTRVDAARVDTVDTSRDLEEVLPGGPPEFFSPCSSNSFECHRQYRSGLSARTWLQTHRSITAAVIDPSERYGNSMKTTRTVPVRTWSSTSFGSVFDSNRRQNGHW